MHAAPCPAHAHRMLEVQHLVVQQVLDRVARTRWPVEDPAHHDGVMGSIVVAQQPLGMMLTPGKLRTPQQSIKEALIEHIEDFFEVVITAFGSAITFGSAGMANLLRLPRNSFAVLETLVAMVVRAVDGLLIDLGDEDVRNGVNHGLLRTFEQIRKTDVQFAFAQPDGCIEGDEAPEADVKRWHRRARP